ncbi:MAG TPA: MMPL family transporter [Bacillales bacterium]|nr:MMPL family transporter [Bacillales bacterium]
MFTRLGAFTYRFRKTIIAAWLIIAIGLGFFALKLPGVLNGSGFETNGEYQKVESIMQQDFGKPKGSMILLFQSKHLATDNPVFHQYVHLTLKKLKQVKVNHLTGVQSPYKGKGMLKKHTAYATLSFNTSFDGLQSSIKEIRKHLKDSSKISVGLTGTAVIATDLNHASQESLARAETVGIPAALIILILAFGGLIAASLPLFIGILSVIATCGIVYFFGVYTDLSIFLLNVIPMVGLALGIDFSLLLVHRFREELAKRPVREALIRTVETAGRSIGFSGFCVFLGLIGMLLIQVNIFQTIALGGMVVVILSVLVAITFLPALLAVLGSNINRFRFFKPREDPKRSAWHRFSAFVMKRPVIMLVLSTIVLLIGLIPVRNLVLTIPKANSLPASYESRTVYKTFQDTFGSKNLSPVVMLVKSNHNIMKKDELNALHQFVESVLHDKKVRKVQSLFSSGQSPKQLYQVYSHQKTRPKIEPLVNQFVHGNKTVVYAYLNVPPDSGKAKDWIRHFDKTQNGFQILLGGQTKFYQEIFDELFSKIPYGLAVVFLSTYIVLLLAFRSVLLPLKAIVMDALSLSATFGILVWLFQEGHLTAPVEIGLMIPVFVFALVFGLSMDYEVFLISRMQEFYERTGDNDYATLMGLTSTSKIITSAAAIMIVVTGSFAFSGVMPIRQLGTGIALAIFLDATIIRMILVPSLMKLLGKWNWWLPQARKRRSYEKSRYL